MSDELGMIYFKLCIKYFFIHSDLYYFYKGALIKEVNPPSMIS